MTSSSSSSSAAAAGGDSTGSSSSSPELFWEAIRDFSCLPLAAIQQQPDRVRDFLTRIGGIDVMFGALAAPIDDVQVRDDVVRCVRAVLASGPGRAALASYPPLAQVLLGGLRHPDEVVRQMAAEQLLGLYDDDDGDVVVRDRLRAVLADDGVFDGVVKGIADPSTSVSEAVSRLLVRIADPERFFSAATCAGLRALADPDPTVLVRVLDLAARIANRSPDAFERFHRSGLLDDVLAQVGGGGGGDLLLQMSMFTVIGIVSQSGPGLRHLTQVPIGALLRRFAPGAAVDAFVTCSALSLVDTIMTNSIRLHLYDWIRDADLRAFLTASMESDDETILQAAIGAVAAIGQSYVGLVEFTRDQHDLLLRLPRIAMRPALSTNALIVAALHGLATVFAAQYDRPEQARAEALRRAIIRGTLSADERAEGVDGTPRFMTKMTKWLTNIDNDLRVAAYRFLAEFGRSRFGLQAIVSGPGLVETLLDRRLEHDAKANLWRFAAVQALGENQSLDDVAAAGRTADLASQIRQHIHMGPYHKGTSTDVAVV